MTAPTHPRRVSAPADDALARDDAVALATQAVTARPVDRPYPKIIDHDPPARS
ncbi:MAG: hypothetical protein AAGE88_08085 [Actinomycetota bacterium]